MHKPDPRANPAAPISLVHQDHPEPPPLHSQPLPHSAHSIPTQTQQPHQPPGLYPPQDHSKQRKPVRSAVEEARLRAQREAESFANSRRDPAKREASITVPAAAAVRVDTWEGGTGVTERRPKRIRTDDISEARRSNSKSSHDKDEKKEEDSEVEKQERYKRRLDMNRESAAVSRVRRRAYVKELEERLAAVEAEKLQLEGKLEIMQSQNDGFKKQLEHLFLMVASGRRPTYPPQPPPAQTQNAPTQSQPPPGGQQGGTAEPPSQ